MDNFIRSPKVTVLMPVYNCELYVKEAVSSILNQTFADFELLIIDDCSTDATFQICKSLTDNRIVLIKKDKNSGYTNSLNYGISIAKGQYIARMDGDDISLPERFAKQVAFLDSNPDVAVCGTCYAEIGDRIPIFLTQNDDKIRIEFLTANCIVHPSVMMRSSIFRIFSITYDITMEPAEDYDLWVRIIAYGKIHNLQEVLFNYRVHNNQTSNLNSVSQFEKAEIIRSKMLGYFGVEINKEEKSLYYKFSNSKSILDFNELELVLSLKAKLLHSNNRFFFDSSLLKKYLDELESEALRNYFIRSKHFSFKTIIEYFSIRKKLQYQFTTIEVVKLIVKSIVRYTKK